MDLPGGIMSRCFVFLLIVPMILGAVNQPAPRVTGVQNAASNIPAGYPASGIAQGSIFTVYGSSLGPATCNQAFAFPVPATMCGVSATVTVNGTSVAPLLLGVYNGNLQGGFAQINAILPSLTPTGNGTIAGWRKGWQDGIDLSEAALKVTVVYA